MRAEAARLRRLHRLEKVRAIAKQAAALEAAQAEGTLAQLRALAERTARMADSYTAREGPTTAQELRQLGQFAAGLRGISASTTNDAARAHADRKQQALAGAERARSAVEDRALAEARSLAQRRQQPTLGARRAIGTALE